MRVLLFLSYSIYLFSSILYLSFLIGGNRKISEKASWLLFFGFLVHSGFLIWRMYLAGHSPMASLFESLNFYVWILILIYIILMETIFKDRSFGSFLIPISLFLLFISIFFPQEVKPLPKILESRWFEIHVFLALFAYASFTISASVGVMYMIQSKHIRGKKIGILFSQLPSLEILDKMGNRAILIGFFSLTLAFLAGSLWGRVAWTGFWRFDPKVVGTIVVWLFYAWYIFVSFLAGWKGRKTAILSITGFVLILFLFLIVGSFMSKVHAF